MQVSNLGIIEINEAPPPLDLSPEEIAALADELVHYHAAFADLYYRKEQAHWGYKYLQGLMLPIERKSIEPMALALDGGDVQAMQQFIGQGQWQDEALLQQHWRLVDETLGRSGWRVHRRWLGRSQARRAFGRGGPPVVRPRGQSRQLPSGGVRRVRQPQRLYAARPAAVSAGRMVRCGAPRAVAASVASQRRPSSRPSRPWPWRCCRPW